MSVKKRYRYRAYPTVGQAQSAARTFGCVRVVFNDFLALKDTLYQRGVGEDVPLSEVQRLVTTLARSTPRRSFLSEVSSVALQQAARDAAQAYMNWFASMGGKRQGPRVGKPRFKKRGNRDSARFTNNSGFKVRTTTHGVAFVRLPKIGDVRFNLSRDLPATPTSVTLIREPDGRFYVSFVVEVPSAKKPRINRAGRVAGLDAGVGDDLLVATYSDGTREKFENPRALRTAQQKLRRLQKSLARKQKGSKNWHKARVRVAAAHRKVRDTRLDHHHKLANKIANENAVVAIETLSLRGIARTRLAKSLHDASIGTLYRLLHEKAETQGGLVQKIGQWEPTTQTCSVCGTPGGKKPLAVRHWACLGCGTHLDRDYNAAVNIMVVAGHAQTLNARGADVRRTLAQSSNADRYEASTHRSEYAHAA